MLEIDCHHFIATATAYELFQVLDLSYLNGVGWPSLSTSNKVANKNHFTEFQFVDVSKQQGNYEQHILKTKTIPTRQENWHDFFNYLIWLIFPRLKKQLNRWQCQELSQRNNNQRSPFENALTLFDENGLILVSSNPELFEMIKQHRWHELFWQHRSQLTEQLQCTVFGHSIHEKLLAPYIGMTGHAVMLLVEPEYFKWERAIQCRYLDLQLQQSQLFTKPKDLQPFPLLGLPGWHPDSQNEAFYLNQAYFRPC